MAMAMDKTSSQPESLNNEKAQHDVVDSDSDKGQDKKQDKTAADITVDSVGEVYVPIDSDEVIDPRLRDYPIPLLAKTVDLHNDPS